MRPPANRKARLSHEFDDYFPGVDRTDLEALKSRCVQWEVDLSASIAEQNARIDRRKISRSQRQQEMGRGQTYELWGGVGSATGGFVYITSAACLRFCVCYY